MFFLTLASIVTSIHGDELKNNITIFIIGCSLTLGGYGIGYGPIPWILSSEMFPTVIRGRIMSISLIASYVSQLITNLVFLLMVDVMKEYGTFGFFLLMNVFSGFLFYLFLVETKTLQPQKILINLNNNYNLVIHNIAKHVCFCYYCFVEQSHNKNEKENKIAKQTLISTNNREYLLSSNSNNNHNNNNNKKKSYYDYIFNYNTTTTTTNNNNRNKSTKSNNNNSAHSSNSKTNEFNNKDSNLSSVSITDADLSDLILNDLILIDDSFHTANNANAFE
jgi:hypothetical protein